MGRPATKMQVLKLDEEFLEELRQKKAEAGDGVEAPQRLTDPMPPKAPVQAEENGEARPASPWTKDAPEAVLVRASALPSSLRPREVGPEAGPGEQGAEGSARGRAKGAVALVVALVVVALGIGARAMFGGVQAATEEPMVKGAGHAATSATMSTAMGTAEEPVAPTMSSAPTVSAAVPVPVAVPSGEPAQGRPRPAGKRTQVGGEDPYADAAAPVKTAVTVAPVVPVVPVVTAVPTAAAPLPQKTASPPSPPPEPTIKPVF